MPTRLTWSRASGRDELRVEGLPDTEIGRFHALSSDELARELPVFASELLDDHAGTRVAPVLAHRLAPMHGEYRCDDAGVTFTPRHSLLRGRSYSAVIGDRHLTVRLPGPEGHDQPTTVVAVHPSGPTVPRNLLRCYVEFSAPMSEGEAARCVSVADAFGVPMRDALLAMDPELWDPGRQQITVLFDPARLKRGLAPHRDVGYPLHEGDSVELVVDASMRDARGLPLGLATRHRFVVDTDIRARVDPTTWNVDAVRSATRDELCVSFGRALDHALLSHCLTVADSRGAVIAGTSRPADADTAWTFLPDRPWRDGPHSLVVDPMLEDVCGNSVTRVFDRDLADPSHARGPDHLVAVSFTSC